MLKFRIKLVGEWLIKAEDEQEAMEKFWDDIVYQNQVDEGTFIGNHLTIEEEVKNEKA